MQDSSKLVPLVQRPWDLADGVNVHLSHREPLSQQHVTTQNSWIQVINYLIFKSIAGNILCF